MAGIMRDAQSVNFQQPGTVSTPQDTTQYVRPDYQKYAGTMGRLGTNTPAPDADSQLLGALAPTLMKWSSNKVDQLDQDAYLQGQADAASGKAQDSMDTDIFTKNWQNAGFSDTKARLGVSNAIAQTAVDIQNKYKEVPPDQFQGYLQQRRDNIMSMTPGMSPEGRRALMVQMATADQTAIAQQAEAYRKNAISTQMQGITTSYNVALDALNASKGDADAYTQASANLVGNVATNISMNPNLDMATKQKAIGDAAGSLLASNNLQAYESMANDVNPATGKTLLDDLPFDTRTSLAKAYMTSRKETADLRNSSYSAQVGLYKAKLADPNSDPVSWDQHNAFIQQGLQNGTLKSGDVETLAQQWAEAQTKRMQATNVAGAWAAGDIQTMARFGTDDQAGADAYVRLQGKSNVPIAQTVTNLAQIGLNTGSAAAFSTVGKLMRSSVNQIGMNGNIDPSQLSGLNAVLQTIGTAEQQGNLGARTAFLGSFDDKTQARLADYWQNLKVTGDPTSAAAAAATNATNEAALTPAARAAMAAGRAQENTDLVNSIQPKGLFGQIWENVVPDLFRSQTNIDTDKIRPANSRGVFSWRDDPESVGQAAAAGKVALLQELDTVTTQHPGLDKDARQAMALSNVAKRVVDTNGAPVIMPQGQTVQSFFGVDPSVSPQLVGSALNVMHPGNDNQRVVYSVTADGQMRWQAYSTDGKGLVDPGGTFDPKTVAAVARAEQDKMTARVQMTDGSGVTQTSPDGGTVNYNGNNTVGIGTGAALQVRNDLYKYEGFRATPYDDASGKIVNGKKVQTVGVGVSSTSDFYPPLEANGQPSAANLSKSFMMASDRAMGQANTAAQKLPPQVQQSPATLRLLSQLAYQGGSVPSSLVQALQSGDREAAGHALATSPQYQMAHQDRKNFYTYLFHEIMPHP